MALLQINEKERKNKSQVSMVDGRRELKEEEERGVFCGYEASKGAPPTGRRKHSTGIGSQGMNLVCASRQTKRELGNVFFF